MHRNLSLNRNSCCVVSSGKLEGELRGADEEEEEERFSICRYKFSRQLPWVIGADHFSWF